MFFFFNLNELISFIYTPFLAEGGRQGFSLPPAHAAVSLCLGFATINKVVVATTIFFFVVDVKKKKKK